MLRELFENPTISGLSEVMRGRKGVDLPKIEVVSREEDLPLSFAQQRLWFLDKLVPNNPFYNMPMALRLKGELKEG